MEGEDHRLVLREQLVEIDVAQPVGMLGPRLQLHQIDDIHHPDLQARQMLPHNGHRGKSLQRRHIATTRHDHVRRHPLVIAGPLPDADSLAAVLDRGIHRQPLRRRVFAGDDYVDVVAAAQAMVHHTQQTVGIRREVNTHNLGLLVDHVVQETRILVREAVVILPPDMRSQHVVQRGNLAPPGQARRDF